VKLILPIQITYDSDDTIDVDGVVDPIRLDGTGEVTVEFNVD
jgi:hypothetical protein